MSYILDDGSPLDLTNATLSLVFSPTAGTSGETRFVGAGTFAINSAVGGTAYYTNAPTDTSTPGYWSLTAKADYGPGASVRYSDPIQIQIRPAP